MEQYWCLSRRDYNLTMLKKIPISTSYISGGMIKAFSTYFETNGTHIKCYSNEEWAQDWFGIDEFGHLGSTPCNTSNVPVAAFGWR